MVALKILQAAEDGNLSLLRTLGPSNLNENVVDDSGSNCLHYAARQGGVDVLKFLISEKGFTGNKRSDVGATPTHDAAAAGNLQTLQWLLKNTQCTVEDQDGIGATVLHLACRYHHTHVTEWLLDQGGCDVNKATASGGLPLHFAVVGHDYEAVKLLLAEDPMTVNLQISNGATAVYLASQEGVADILRTLVQDHRGNIKMKSYDGMSCVHAASQSGHLDCVQVLVEEEKYNPNERDFDGATPLHYAASQGHAHIIDWLMKEGGARVTLDNLGGSPLHNAAEMNSTECVRTLINNGCDTTLTDNNGLTAAELARKCYHDNCAKLIETYTAQSQTPVEPDVEYLLSAQSPRINLLRPYVTQFDGRQPPNTPSFLTKDTETEYTTVNKLGINGNQSSLKTKSQSVESIQAQADPGEFPLGIPRSVSQDFSVDSQPPAVGFEFSPLSSSLSSLSQLDDVLDKASKEIEASEANKKPADHIQKLNKQHFLSNKPGTNINSKPYITGSHDTKPQNIRNTAINGGFSYLKSNQTESKFNGVSRNDPQRVILLNGNRMASNDIDTETVAEINGEVSIDDSETTQVNGLEDNGDHHGDTGSHQGDGSVQNTHIIVTNDTNYTTVTAPNIDSYTPPLDGYTSPGQKPALNLDIRPHTGQTQPLVNGHATPPSVYIADSSHTNQNSQQNQNVHLYSDISSIEKDGKQQMSGIYINGTEKNDTEPPLVPFSQPEAGTISQSPQVEAMPSQLEAPPPQPEDPPTSVPAPPIPPPPPPPALPIFTKNTQPVSPGDGPTTNQPLNQSAIDEAKRKSISLPARPTALFTAEMMQSKRSTLTPAPAKTVINSTQSPNTDFISELKMATKGPALRRTSRSDGSPKPAMVFTSGQKQTPKDTQNEAKDTKVELVGEWDPKNFVDHVPNKDNLPSWKVQLQAKQIAEKTMKETLEQRKVDERENRFKNMPAWKRALVEKKEAEARAAEEKRQEEEQKSKVSTKKTLNISVTPKTKDNNSSLAPWQLELQNKD